MQTLRNQTLAALEDNTNTLKSVEHQRQRQSSVLDNLRNSFTDQASPISPVKLKDDRGKTFDADNDMIDILLLMGKQTNKQFELKSVDPNSNKLNINGVDVSLVPDGIKRKGKDHDFSKGFALFITIKDVTKRHKKGVENKLKQFLRDIGYKQRDTKSNNSKIIRRMLANIGEATSHVISIVTSSEDKIYRRDTSDCEQVIVEEEEEEEEEETDYETDKQIEASGLSKADPNNLIERLEL